MSGNNIKELIAKALGTNPDYFQKGVNSDCRNTEMTVIFEGKEIPKDVFIREHITELNHRIGLLKNEVNRLRLKNEHLQNENKNIKWMNKLMSGLTFGDAVASCASIEVIKERQRQIEQEKFSAERDDQYTNGELARTAAAYALPENTRDVPIVFRDIYQHVTIIDILRIKLWPWSEEWWKPSPNNRRRELIKAAALIVAEIERLDRKCEAKK